MSGVARQFFKDHPQHVEGVTKAYYAFHAAYDKDQKAHSFYGQHREAPCHLCGRTREQVRWDELEGPCQKRIQDTGPSIGEVILREEQAAFKLLKRADVEVPKLVAKIGMSGETLAVLYHTHGFNPETVATVVEVPTNLISEFELAMERERSLSRAAHKKETITVAAA